MKQGVCSRIWHHKHAHTWHGHGGFPAALLIFPITMISASVISVWLIARITAAVETLAMIDALDELETRLSDAERADLEGRIRQQLFSS